MFVCFFSSQAPLFIFNPLLFIAIAYWMIGEKTFVADIHFFMLSKRFRGVDFFICLIACQLRFYFVFTILEENMGSQIKKQSNFLFCTILQFCIFRFARRISTLRLCLWYNGFGQHGCSILWFVSNRIVSNALPVVMLWCTQLKHYIKSKETKSRRLTLAGAFFISYFYYVLIRFSLDILYKNKVK